MTPCLWQPLTIILCLLCPLLLSMQATEKFGGNKEKRAAGMCEFTKERLHSPYTMATAQAMSRGDKQYQKEIKDKAINISDTVQKFMRQRNSLKIPQRLDELLTDCLQHEFLRDECYIGIIRQCTNNIDDDDKLTKPEQRVNACALGVELLALCLTVFPPSEAFEDYVEYFVRTGPLVKEMEKYNCKGQLRKTAFLGADTEEVIDPEHFEETCEYVGRAYLGGALTKVLPARLELESFEPIEYTDKKTAPWLSLKKDSKPPKDGASPRRNGKGGSDNSDESPRSSASPSHRSGGGKKSKKKSKKKDKKSSRPEPESDEPAPVPEKKSKKSSKKEKKSKKKDKSGGGSKSKSRHDDDEDDLFGSDDGYGGADGDEDIFGGGLFD